VAWEVAQKNLILNYAEIFNVGVWGVDFIRGVLYNRIYLRYGVLGI
jgi:hypothetical protein